MRKLQAMGDTVDDGAPRPPRWRDEHPMTADDLVRRRVREALDRAAARGADPADPLEAAARRWAA